LEPKLLLSDIADIMDCSIHNVHMLIKDRGVKTEKSSNRVYLTDPRELKKLIDIDIPNKKICVQTSKGGVGKSSLTIAIAIRAWLYGARVLVVDLDQQANQTKLLLKGKKATNAFIDVLEEKSSIQTTIQPIFNNFDLLPSTMKNSMLSNYMIAYGLNPESTVREALKPVEDNYDIIIFDCPPAIGHIISSTLYYSDLVIAPIDPDDDAVDGMKVCWKEVKKINKASRTNREFKIILNKYDQRTIMSTRILNTLMELDTLKECLYETIIGVSQDFVNCKMEQVSIFDAPRPGKAAKDVDSIVKDILGLHSKIES
jgi:chromosome partitioning protein